MIDPMKYRDINPGFRVLMGPGPSDVATRVLQAMAAPCIGHLDPYFLETMDETQQLLRYLFQASFELTIPVSGTGSAGMETCFDVYFTDRPIKTYRDALKADTDMLEKYKIAMRKHRIIKNSHKYYPSLCHTDEDVEQTIAIFEKVAAELKR